MVALKNTKTLSRLLYGALFLFMLLIAFLEAHKATADLNWYCAGDFSRDLAFAQGYLSEGFGMDPNFQGQYIWYNPLLTTIEALISRWTAQPLNIVLSRAGTYLNLLCPITFFLMMLRITDRKKAIAGVASYIFLASGMLPPFYTATYSAWAFPNCFIQFIFFLNIIFVYQAFQTGRLKWFLILGASLGVSCLGHAAPTVVVLLILVSIQAARIFQGLRSKDYQGVKSYFLQGVVTFIPFAVVSFPLLYYIVGKYHLHSLNRAPFEYVDTIFIWRNWRDMLRQNVSLPLLVSVFGFIRFLRHEKKGLVRQILLNWLGVTLIMYLYSSTIVGLDRHFHIQLLGTVPSYHYFVYMKALQSVFFGYGFLFLAQKLIEWSLRNVYAKGSTGLFPLADLGFLLLILLTIAVYFPKYVQRPDFVQLRGFAKDFSADSSRIGVYYYILHNVPSNKVILCGEHASIFPVMSTARKMVSIGITYANPYVEFAHREADRNDMMHFLETGTPATAAPLIDLYDVDYVLIENDSIRNKNLMSPWLDKKVFENSMYSFFTIDHGGR
jgi:hypothetical protein